MAERTNNPLQIIPASPITVDSLLATKREFEEMARRHREELLSLFGVPAEVFQSRDQRVPTMTETEWLACEDPGAMLAFATHQQHNNRWHHAAPSDRKLRLFACACAVACYGHKRAVTANEGGYYNWQNGDPDDDEGKDSPSRLARSWCETGDDISQAEKAALLREIVGNPFRPVTCEPGRCSWLTPAVLSLAQAAYDERAGRVCGTCRNIRNVWLDPCPDCHGAGRVGDGTLDPDRLAILADALEEAGCPADEECPRCEGDGDARIDLGKGHIVAVGLDCRTCKGTGRVPSPLLAHLRSPGPHVRGCWALDLLLGKE